MNANKGVLKGKGKKSIVEFIEKMSAEGSLTMLLVLLKKSLKIKSFLFQLLQNQRLLRTNQEK